jgi:hypothetical protein
MRPKLLACRLPRGRDQGGHAYCASNPGLLLVSNKTGGQMYEARLRPQFKVPAPRAIEMCSWKSRPSETINHHATVANEIRSNRVTNRPGPDARSTVHFMFPIRNRHQRPKEGCDPQLKRDQKFLGRNDVSSPIARIQTAGLRGGFLNATLTAIFSFAAGT